jgi:predicted Abi (CAAX) family protease
MLGNWLTCIVKKIRKMIFVGVAALLWVIWCTRNDLVFEKKHFQSFMQVIFREHIGCDFGLCCSTRTQEKSSIQQAKH